MKIQNVTVAGGGVLGSQIAYQCAYAGFHVTTYLRSEASVQRAQPKVARLHKIYQAELTAAKEHGGAVSRGLIFNGDAATADYDALLRQADEAFAHFHYETDLAAAVADADLVIEAVFEDMKIKRDIFAKLEARCRPDTIFCTNSSVMSPSEISAELQHRERFVGTHFWNPGHLIPLVEVVKSDASSDEVAQTVMDVLASAGKEPVLCKKDVPGFIANRMQHALWREAISIVERGIADAATVDKAVRYSFGLRLPQLGPMENADMVGTDLTYNIHDYILKDLEDSHEPSPLLKKLRDEGKIGFKTGEGFQTWTPGQIKASNEGLNDYLVDMLYGKKK